MDWSTSIVFTSSWRTIGYKRDQKGSNQWYQNISKSIEHHWNRWNKYEQISFHHLSCLVGTEKVVVKKTFIEAVFFWLCFRIWCFFGLNDRTCPDEHHLFTFFFDKKHQKTLKTTGFFKCLFNDSQQTFRQLAVFTRMARSWTIWLPRVCRRATTRPLGHRWGV